ncbi:SDR family oxidoreductase [uncultured Novosphingobium sp.]|uniref:SDR family NAD(P)-dependent oxidoreductase n=1 Tax=uncultured Novosphingobium sp. TaxID=292277 RepID=UPI002594ABAD|nr:SDR family oxidoreductase [uncultured Novosphingobium sp.]
MSLSPSAALVTGASSGIGAVYADRLAGRGHDLVLVARRRDRLESLATEIRVRHGRKVEVVTADLTDEADLGRVEALVRDTPDLSILANIAGLGALGPAAMIDPATVGDMVKVNVLALTRLSLAAARRFVAVKHGTIINIGSIIAMMPVPGAGGYSGSKSYVLNFSRSLQAELTDSGVTVQVVMPGPVRSEFFGDKPAPFPDALFMSAETLVDTALAALDQGETITFPNLSDLAAWEQFEAARGVLVKGLTQSGQAADRYAKASA